MCIRDRVKSTFEAPLRHNSVETFDEFNTGLNVGKGTPTVWWDIIPNSDKCEIYAYMAGGGCTLPGKAMVLMPGAGYEGVTKFVMDVMTSYGINACPPLLVALFHKFYCNLIPDFGILLFCFFCSCIQGPVSYTHLIQTAVLRYLFQNFFMCTGHRLSIFHPDDLIHLRKQI